MGLIPLKSFFINSDKVIISLNCLEIDMSIKSNLILSSIVLTILFLAVGMIVFMGYRHVSSQASISNSLDNEGKYLTNR